ncbi:hypothetical protein [Hyphomicrobium sp. CS1GBMeth3]|uniref:hypothetical protein n=1 Tax=Hyphomicrobium sp. CS1GBMeth3 TaxID=1892845 RepID=UPI0015C55DDC|nr:hypothetical protein [Hyphomicrobium sp. CS1GBMeth3]
MADPWDFTQNPEFPKRIAITLAALAIYRLGTWIPLAGVDPNVLVQHAGESFSGSARAHGSILALGVVPLLSAAILAEVAMTLWPKARAWAGTPRGCTRLAVGVVLVALLLAALQAYGIATAFEAMPGLVAEPGGGFHTSTVVSLVAGTALVAALASSVTHAGVGGGLWVLLAATHIDALVNDTLGHLVLMAQGALTGSAVVAHLAISLGALALAVAVLAALIKATPRLSDPDELIWVPLLGSTLAGWVLGAVALLQWLLLPAGAPDLAALVATHALPPLLALAFAVVVLLRRRSLAAGSSLRVAAAAPVILALSGLLALSYAIPALTSGGLHLPNPASTLVLAAVGLMVLENLRQSSQLTRAADPLSS